MSGSMKEIWAIVRRDRIKRTREVMDSLGLGAMSVMSVSGRGKQAGFVQSEIEAMEMPDKYATAAPSLVPTPGSLAAEGATLTRPVTYIPKKIITMIVPASLVPEAVEGIISANRTGQQGDGKIFVFPVEDSFRIRTGERGLDSINY